MKVGRFLFLSVYKTNMFSRERFFYSRVQLVVGTWFGNKDKTTYKKVLDSVNASIRLLASSGFYCLFRLFASF